MLKPIITPLTVILLLSLSLGAICSRQIVDFEYAEYTHVQEQSLNQRQDFNFQPAPIPESQLKFPQVCSLIDELVDAQKQQAGKFSSTDIDAYLNKMKAKFLSLLTLTQQLQNSESKILHFEHLINQTHPLAPQESDIIQIEGYEQRLHSLSEQITRLDQLLKSNLSLIEDASVNYHLSEAKKIQLDFKIDWLKQKKNYLHSFQIRSKQARSRQGPDANYTEFFDELQAQFIRQTSQIQTIDEIIEKKSTLILLRQEKSQIQSSITALELYIQDIHQCIREKQNIRQQFKNHDKINELINELKELKKNEAGPNPYCEGVATKLTEKIRTMVRYYGIVASCSSDQEQKVKELNDAKQRLNEIMAKIQQLESVEDMADFRVKYNAQKQVIDNVFLKIKDWKIKQFVHDPQQIQALRLKTQQQLQKLTRQRAPPCIPEGTPRSAISQQVVDLIKQIRQLKYQYCDLYAKYDSLSNTLWSETYRYESEVKLKNKLIEMYNSERRLYNFNHQKLIKLRNEIVELLS